MWGRGCAGADSRAEPNDVAKPDGIADPCAVSDCYRDIRTADCDVRTAVPDAGNHFIEYGFRLGAISRSRRLVE